MFADLPPDALLRVVSRTAVGSGIAGAIGAIVALLLGYPLAIVGIAIGIAMGLLGLRDLTRQVTRTDGDVEPSMKEARRQMGSRTLLRLLLVTGISMGALFVSPSLGIGIMSGLVLYQFTFVVGALRLVASQGGIK